MNNNTDTRAQAKKWYDSLSESKCFELCTNYFPDVPFIDITWDHVDKIYLAENPTNSPEPESMSKEQAIEAMKAGAKVAHRYFSPHEYITMEGNLTIITEEGYSVSTVEFWKYRAGKEWLTDWHIWSNPTIKEADNSVEGFTGEDIKNNSLNWFAKRKLVFSGVNAGSYLDEEDFEIHVNWVKSIFDKDNLENEKLEKENAELVKALKRVINYMDDSMYSQSAPFIEATELLNRIFKQ